MEEDIKRILSLRELMRKIRPMTRLRNLYNFNTNTELSKMIGMKEGTARNINSGNCGYDRLVFFRRLAAISEKLTNRQRERLRFRFFNGEKHKEYENYFIMLKDMKATAEKMLSRRKEA